MVIQTFMEVGIHEVYIGITLTNAEREQKQLGVFIDLHSLSLLPALSLMTTCIYHPKCKIQTIRKLRMSYLVCGA